MSWVYVMAAPHAVKIGVTTRDPEQRLRAVQDAAGAPVTLEATFQVEDGHERGIESDAHFRLAEHRTYGEWFTTSVDEAVDAVRWALSRRYEVEPRKEITRPPAPPAPPAEELAAAIRDLERSGIAIELAAIHVLGGRATTRQIASALAGDPPPLSASLSLGRRCGGHCNYGYLARGAHREWVLTDKAREQIAQAAA